MFSFSTQYSDGENTYKLIAALFLRLLAVIYFIAFFTLTFQITGLAGEDGILPLSPWLDYLLNDMAVQPCYISPRYSGSIRAILFCYSSPGQVVFFRFYYSLIYGLELT